MTDIVSFQCEYLMFSSGYEISLLDKIDNLNAFCREKGVIPLAIVNSIFSGAQPIIIPVRNGVINLDVQPTIYETERVNNVVSRLNRNNLGKSDGILFQVGYFKNATDVFLDMKSLDYCNMYDIVNMKFLRNEQGNIDLVYVHVDAEAG
jgi:hypothetical protein